MFAWFKRLFRREPLIFEIILRPDLKEWLSSQLQALSDQPEPQLFYGTVLSVDDDDTYNVALNDGRVVQADVLEGPFGDSIVGFPFFIARIDGKYFLNPPVYR